MSIASEKLVEIRTQVQRHLDRNYSPRYTQKETDFLSASIKEQLEAENAVLVAHYYTDPEIQRLADQTGGCVADSLEMARFGRDHPASTLVVAGVRFMGETAKILTPEKRVLMPTLDATCSLDIGCPIHEFSRFCDNNPERTVVVYANTSAAVKARADWVVTSSIALEVAHHLANLDQTILWAPDKHLGDYVQRETGADILMWEGACVVHEEFKARGIHDLKHIYKDAALLAHPESPASVAELADFVGSTSQIIQAAKDLPNDIFIIATDQGIFHKLKEKCPDKDFLIAPTAGSGAACRSCANCPWMAMNELQSLADVFSPPVQEIFVDENLSKSAMIPLRRMLEFSAQIRSN